MSDFKLRCVFEYNNNIISQTYTLHVTSFQWSIDGCETPSEDWDEEYVWLLGNADKQPALFEAVALGLYQSRREDCVWDTPEDATKG